MSTINKYRVNYERLSDDPIVGTLLAMMTEISLAIRDGHPRHADDVAQEALVDSAFRAGRFSSKALARHLSEKLREVSTRIAKLEEPPR